MGTGTAVATYDKITATKMNLKLEDYLSTAQKAYFGSGAGATNAIALDGTDPDQILQAHGKVTSAVASGAYASGYNTLTVTASQTNDVSCFGHWAELYITGGTIDLTPGSNYVAIWGNLEISGTVTSTNSSCYMAGLCGTVITPSTFTNNTYVCGVMADNQMVSGYTNNLAVVAFYARKGSGKAGWQHILLVDTGTHCTINTTDSDKTVRVNSRTYTSAASIIGLQTKPRAGVNMTNDIIGVESMPGMNSTFTNSAGIVCFKAEPYIHATAGAITGDVRGYEVSLGCPSGAGTITGTLSGIKFINNTAKAVTGGIYPIYVITHGDAQPWSGLMKLPDNGGSIADLASAVTTVNAVVKIVVGSTTTYLVGYQTYTAS